VRGGIAARLRGRDVPGIAEATPEWIREAIAAGSRARWSTSTMTEMGCGISIE
jgi:hypothetical protein